MQNNNKIKTINLFLSERTKQTKREKINSYIHVILAKKNEIK